MKDTKLPLAAYGISDGSRIAMMGTKPTERLPPPPTSSTTTNEPPKIRSSQIERIDAILSDGLPQILSKLQFYEAYIIRQRAVDGQEAQKQSVEKLRPTLFADLEPILMPFGNLSISDSSPSSAESRERFDGDYAYRELSEYLLRLLMRFDEIVCGDDDDLRAHRKQSVQRIQRLQEYVDFLRSRA